MYCRILFNSVDNTKNFKSFRNFLLFLKVFPVPPTLPRILSTSGPYVTNNLKSCKELVRFMSEPKVDKLEIKMNEGKSGLH